LDGPSENAGISEKPPLPGVLNMAQGPRESEALNMSNPIINQRKIKIGSISEADNLRRFERNLVESWKAKKVEDKGQYVLTHLRIPLFGNHNLEVMVYTSDIVFISTSPNAASGEFDRMAELVAKAADSAKRSVSAMRPITVLRAKSLLEFAKQLKLDDENQRMVAVITSDISNEVMLTERMKAEGIQGPPLSEGIPNKIALLQKKGVNVPRAKEVVNTRELRNLIVHNGQIPDKAQAQKCLEVTTDLCQNL